MSDLFERRYYNKEGKLSSVRRSSGNGKGMDISALFTGGILLVMGYLFLAGVIGWSKQMMYLFIIIGAIWWLSR